MGYTIDWETNLASLTVGQGCKLLFAQLAYDFVAYSVAKFADSLSSLGRDGPGIRRIRAAV